MHEIRASFSKLKKKFKGSFGKGKPQPANAAGEGVGQTRQASSLPHPEPPVVVGGNGSREGGGVTDASLQQGQPGPVPTTGSNIDPGRPEVNANAGQAGEPNSMWTLLSLILYLIVSPVKRIQQPFLVLHKRLFLRTMELERVTPKRKVNRTGSPTPSPLPSYSSAQ